MIPNSPIIVINNLKQSQVNIQLEQSPGLMKKGTIRRTQMEEVDAIMNLRPPTSPSKRKKIECKSVSMAMAIEEAAAEAAMQENNDNEASEFQYSELEL